jgi:hypothetical protein
MCLNLNGNSPFPFIHLCRVLIELDSGKLPEPFSYVRRLL